MQPEKERADTGAQAGGFETLACPSCRATMVRGMRFCRLCGYRLGEGLEEYAETRRFNMDAPPVTKNTSPTNFTMPPQWGAMTPAAPLTSMLNRQSARFQSLQAACGTRRGKWKMWIVIAFAIMAATGVFSGVSDGIRREVGSSAGVEVERSYVGADIEDGDGGALVESVMPPGSPADLAGLVGGDVITAIDGRSVKSQDDFIEALGAIPVGKTVEAKFVRDGVERMTKLTTISDEQREHLSDAFAGRPEGEGFLGIDPGDVQRVFVEQEKVHGIRLGDVLRNRPAYIAGLRDGDIVLEFDGVPIRTEGEFFARINRALPDSLVRVLVVRDGARIEIPVKMGQD